MKVTTKIEGLRELNDAIEELSKATGRNVVRRTLTKALYPMEQRAETNAPVGETRHLRESIEISAKISKRQGSLHRAEYGSKAIRTSEGFRMEPQTTVWMFMGPSGSAKSIVQEFGSIHVSPQPYMRPAWEGGKEQALKNIRDDLWDEVKRAAERVARKTARLARG
jgi:HK97 gp10 family phage protein